MTFETFLLVNFNFIFNEIESYASGPCTQNDCIPSKTSRLQAIPFDPRELSSRLREATL